MMQTARGLRLGQFSVILSIIYRVHTWIEEGGDLMTLKRTRGILYTLAALLVLCLILLQGTDNGLFLALASGVGIVAFCIFLLFWTCPECGRHLGRTWGGKYCPRCGAKLDL